MSLGPITSQELRRDYTRGQLLEAELDSDPMAQFAHWFEDAVRQGIPQPNAVTLATVDAAGNPSARIVLVKSFDAHGFVFCTNYTSRKGRDLAANPRAAIVFFWEPLEQQVRIEGVVEKTRDEESDRYFHERPREAQIGAWVSDQSAVIRSRAELEDREKSLIARFADGPIPRPDFWGGYRLTPNLIEFWQGRPSRLHDRLVYEKQSDGRWKIYRVAP